MGSYEHLFNKKTYEDEECIHFYQVQSNNTFQSIFTLDDRYITVPEAEPYLIPESIFNRMICIGKAYRLHYLSLFSLYENYELNPTQIQSVIKELEFLMEIVNDILIEQYVIPLLKLLDGCILGSKKQSLWILGV
ncbi:hypothetical protein [Alkalihalobacillus deserti]|uniref:hypothetical protein n=1 Tax=Alkalihalobacillus deserti TaxID=2879466 RepID=UPI001D15BBE7|nr:hypothetical protein [Alkalihalobacillus deserti]